jgi:hypothetical protein
VFVSRDRVRDTYPDKTASSSFLAELPRFENSRNVEMTTKSLCVSRSDLIVALPLGPSLSNHFLSYAATKFL